MSIMNVKESSSDIKKPPYVIIALVGIGMTLLDYVFHYNGFRTGSPALTEIMTAPSMHAVFREAGYAFRGFGVASMVIFAYNVVFAKGKDHFRERRERMARIAASGAVLARGGGAVCITGY